MWNRPDFPIGLAKALSDLERGTLSISKISETVDRLVSQVENVLVNNSSLLYKNIEELDRISHNLQDFVESFKPIAEELVRISSDYDRLLLSLNEINKHLASIEEIASHTELIAINASIEASKAGREGRTFAIVAKEIGDMAKRTFKLIYGIRDMERDIEPVLKGIKNSVEAMNEVKTKIDKLVADIDKVIAISRELSEINKTQSEVVLELKGLSGVSVALQKIYFVLSKGKGFLARSFSSIFKFYRLKGKQ